MPASSRRPIRIGNCSGAIGDGIDQIYHIAKSGNVDAITGDYLAEFNLAWKAIELQSHPDRGYESNFLEQLAWGNGDAARLVAKNRIKIVHDGGALNPKGLAKATDSYFRSLGINDVKIAWVSGDNVTDKAREGTLGPLAHLDREGVTLSEASIKKDLLSANIYTGQAGIVRALGEGADIVICGRCCDASPVMALSSWWHRWGDEEYSKLAGALMAGHLTECGPYVTGGNFCGAREIESLYELGYPIAEVASDGTSVITKAPGTNGAVTIDTCKAQLLYEIQGTVYLNTDVTADIEDARLEEVGKDRVRLTGIRGSAPPSTAKLAVCLFGGWQAELSSYCAGLDTDFKFRQMRDGLLRHIDPNDFTAFSVEKYGSSPANPRRQADCTVHIRIFAQSPKKEAMEKVRRAIFFNGMQGYSGLHLAMDWRTMEPRMYVRYFPALIPQTETSLSVHFVSGSPEQAFNVPPRPASKCTTRILPSKNYEPATPPPSQDQTGTTVRRPLGDLVFARSGDKAGNANVGFWVRDASAWPWLQSFLSSRRLIDLLADEWQDGLSVERCEFSSLWAVHFVVKGILQEGVSSSSILDGFAKSFGEFLRARHVDLPETLVRQEDQRRETAMSRVGLRGRL